MDLHECHDLQRASLTWSELLTGRNPNETTLAPENAARYDAWVQRMRGRDHWQDIEAEHRARMKGLAALDMILEYARLPADIKRAVTGIPWRSLWWRMNHARAAMASRLRKSQSEHHGRVVPLQPLRRHSGRA